MIYIDHMQNNNNYCYFMFDILIRLTIFFWHFLYKNIYIDIIYMQLYNKMFSDPQSIYKFNFFAAIALQFLSYFAKYPVLSKIWITILLKYKVN